MEIQISEYKFGDWLVSIEWERVSIKMHREVLAGIPSIGNAAIEVSWVVLWNPLWALFEVIFE